MIGIAEKVAAGGIACLVCLVLGYTAGARVTQTACDKAALEVENDQLEREKGWQQERDAAATRAAEAAALTAGQQASLKKRNSQLEQEVAAYAKDQTRERRQCFDARGSSLWNQLAADPTAATPEMRRQPDAAGGSPAAGPAGGGGGR